MTPALPAELPADPLDWVAAWLDAASAGQVQRNPNSMTLATVADGRPSARVVLCKAFVADPGYLVFYTNYRSQKAAELDANPLAAATFHWDALGRQVRLEGPAVRSPAQESDAYFATRDRGSQLGAWGSDQSAPLESRQALVSQLRERAAALGVTLTGDMEAVAAADTVIPRPAHWGGIRLWPASVELWIEGADRIHDRARWTRPLSASGDHEFAAGDWTGTRLQP